MAKSAYPTGVENHGGTRSAYGSSIKVAGCVKASACRIHQNRKVAGELRASVCFAIKTGNFNYAAQFPDSPNLKRFGVESKEITVLELANKWLELKRMEISTNAMSPYPPSSDMCQGSWTGWALAVTQEDLLFIRKELLTGYHTLKAGQKTPVKGRSVRTVNNYMKIMGGCSNLPLTAGMSG